MSILVLWVGEKGQVLEMPQQNRQSFNTRANTQRADGYAAETVWGKSRVMRGKGTQAMCQGCLTG